MIGKLTTRKKQKINTDFTIHDLKGKIKKVYQQALYKIVSLI
jgi:hypothetical protein